MSLITIYVKLNTKEYKIKDKTDYFKPESIVYIKINKNVLK